MLPVNPTWVHVAAEPTSRARNVITVTTGGQPVSARAQLWAPGGGSRGKWGNMEAILELAQRLYRGAQHTSMAQFQALALEALTDQVRFRSALWFTGRVSDGQLQIHRLHAHRLAPEAIESVLARLRAHPQVLSPLHSGQDIELSGCTAPGPAGREVVGDHALLARAAALERGGEWLWLHRPPLDPPFDNADQTALAMLMPHLAEARRVNRALCLQRVTHEPGLAPAPHRALTLPDGTVLHCGQLVSAAIEAGWPRWGGLRLPAPLLASALAAGVVPLANRAERLITRRFSDSLVLSLASVPVSERLTQREYQVIRLLATGRDYRFVARRYAVEPGTVRTIMRRSYRKLGITSREQLVQLLARTEGSA